MLSVASPHVYRCARTPTGREKGGGGGADLDGDLLARLAIDPKLDLGEVAGSESLPDLILIDNRLVDVRVLDFLHDYLCGRGRG